MTRFTSCPSRSSWVIGGRFIFSRAALASV